MFPGSRRSSGQGRPSGSPRHSGSGSSSPRATGGRQGVSRRGIAYAYFAVDRYDWSTRSELPQASLWDRVYTAATQGMYSLYEPTDPNLPQGQYTGVLMQVACLEGVPFSNSRQKAFIHDGLVRTTREKLNRSRGRR